MTEIKEIFTKKEKQRFFRFPIDLYRDCEYYVPALIGDEMDTFNPKKNGAYSYAESRLWLAYRKGKIVGRIGAILNHAANKKDNVKQLRFTRFDFIDDFEVSKMLFDTAVAWARELGMTELVGPLGFSNLDKQGMLIDGFDQMNMYITLYNYPYYITHMERLGLVKKWDWIEMKIIIPEKNPEKIEQIAAISEKRYGYSGKKFKNMKEVRPYIREAMEIINSAFAKLHGVVPLSVKQINNMEKILMLVGRPEYCLMVQNREGELVGFAFMAPSISRGIRSSNGKLGLFSILKILKDLNDHRHIDFYLIGIRPNDQKKGVAGIILRDGFMAATPHGGIDCQTGPMLEDNANVQNIWKNYEHNIHRRRRCWSYMIPEK